MTNADATLPPSKKGRRAADTVHYGVMAGVRFDHIAIAVARLADAPALLAGRLGGVPVFGADAGAYRFGQWRFTGGGRIEVLEPAGADGFLHRFLAQRGPGIHHVTFRVPSLAAACERAAAHGYAVVGYSDSKPNWKEAFLHPRQALGIVVQLAEAAGGGEGPRRWQPPAGPADPPPPVTMLGLRLRARSAERARLQWERVLEGAAGQDAGGPLVYRWPGSPLRLAIEIDPGAEEGPVCIEFASGRPVELPETPVPAAVFARRPA